jgi:hypothetical protein
MMKKHIKVRLKPGKGAQLGMDENTTYEVESVEQRGEYVVYRLKDGTWCHYSYFDIVGK